MPIYHVTVQHDGTQNVFYFSGEGTNMPPWKNTIESLEYFSNCDGSDEDHEPGASYKFDQSDPTNNGHPLHFSFHLDGTHQGYVSMGPSSGVYRCGTPGSPGAFTETNVGEWYDDMVLSTIYPYCSNHAGMGGTTIFDAAENSNGICGNNYGGWLCDSSACTLESHLTGMLTEVIKATNQELSGQYSDFTITSYGIATGYHAGSFELCHIVGSGSSETTANNRRQSLSNLFFNSGICTDDRLGGLVPSPQNINNANISFNFPRLVSGSANYYESHVTGFTDKKYYVNYTPTISGQKIAITSDVNCPDTQAVVTLNRNETTWVSSGLAVKAEGWDGWTTTLTADCTKVSQGYKKYCPVNVSNNSSECWENDFPIGDYRLLYKSGSFVDAEGLHFIGTGNLTTSRLV